MPHDRVSRRALRRSGIALSALGGLGAAALLYAIFIEPRRLRVRHVAVTVPDLPEGLEGLRAAFLSDFHLGGAPGNERVARAARAAIDRERPDLILLGGDYFDHARWQSDGESAAPLAEWPAPTFAVLGNHDFKGGPANSEAIAALLERQGVCVLRNASTSIRLRGQDVVIAGVDDPYLELADLDKALGGATRSRPLVLLAHAPSIAPLLPPGAAGVVLTGHTHGGQVRLSPFTTLTPLDISFYLDGLYRRPHSPLQRGFHWVRGSLLYVTNGLGVTRWRMRFMSPPEAVILHFTATPADPDAPCDDVRRYVRWLR
ncbi:metallophosphoesterase [Sphaerobacter sp.]|mgnify:CR=1 FL=1|uniref:metallophosphoesterase n=1 Tax=Sphaerobacter sp. TaxID=2099654 RepID=UPI001DF95AEF|nr:metallophosphoesterase [Sphaerobacter sp.]MBX5444054.1 metallophosphoesterase [Sphaerobacter sp.]